MPVSSSASRTPVAEAAGAQTQLTSGRRGARSSACCWSRCRVSWPTCRPRPWRPSSSPPACRSSTSASIVRLWRIGSSEFWLALASFLGVALVGVIEGVFLAVALSLLAFIRRAWWPHDAVLGRADGVKGYHDLTYYPDARQVPGLLLYRFDAPLFFANAEVFRDRVRERIAEADEPVRWVVIAAEPITDVDTTAAAMLDELQEELDRRGHHAGVRRAQGPGQGTAAPLRRADRHARRVDVPDRRDGRQRVPAATGEPGPTGRSAEPARAG